MNRKSIILAQTIASRIFQQEEKQLSSIEKDILLEDIRNLYRLVQEDQVVETTKIQAPVIEQKETFAEAPAPQVSPEVITPNAPIVEEQRFEVETPIVIPSVIVTEVESAQKVQEETFVEAPVEPATTEQKSTEVEPEENYMDSSFNSKYDAHDEPIYNDTSSINSAFKSDDNSINRKNTSTTRELHSSVGSSSFSALLDLNKRILFTRELFGDNNDSFLAFVQQLEKCNNLTEAKSLVNTTALSKSWKLENDAVRLLVGLVKQHFEYK